VELEYKIQNSKFIGGLKYLPIRKTMQSIQFEPAIKNDDTPLKILVVGGGTDPNNFVGQVAKELNFLKRNFYAVLFTNGNTNLGLLDSRFLIKKIGLELETELRSTDLVLTLSGTSSWDYLSSGFPIGIALGFENQRDNFEFQISNEIAIDIGGFDGQKNLILKKDNFLKLIENTELRLKLSKKATSCFDQLGAVRIAKEITEFGAPKYV
jgi:spore coat polysaccharide biosynthesis predicted glycosyltransferase SpsG